MKISQPKSNTRFILSIALFAAAFLSALFISMAANKGASYWTITHPIPKGVQLTSADITPAKISLGRNSRGYLLATSNPVGSITRRELFAGELINYKAITNDSAGLSTVQLSISVRAVDFPSDAKIGEIVDLYQLHDTRNNEVPIAPVRISMSAFLDSIDRKGNSFGGDVGVTLSVDRSEVEQILASTTSGRIVIVSSHG